ncbi:AraC family transcriptional regulator [Flavobacterium suaedae]|uniref:AraC family transcriptional regulator n=1 Tax=Flavobacterium suaedae TaxID=1767027 RepID=A0ABQ1K212_9FLAO|nr:DUF6597 domain-containing transcriptional factor [Flavobacterium suaedae]GGB81373.1 AraC family transcriptional regulator [Flavobacterium suaedae]
MNYYEIKPSEFLKSFIKCFWFYENDVETTHTILPDGYFDIIATVEDEQIVSLTLTGIWNTPKEVKLHKNTTIYGIRFKLPAVEYLFRKEIQSILNTFNELPLHFWGINTTSYTSLEQYVEYISNYIETVAEKTAKPDDKKILLFRLVYQKQTFSVKEIAEKLNWSSRQINRYFKSQFGITLKDFINIVRCNSAYKDIAKGNLYPQNNFYDQAHCIKEVKKYTGTTPKKLYKNDDDRFLQLSHSKFK